MAKRDYYEVLGLSKTSSQDDVKRAYRNLALKYHPDRVTPDKKKEAEEKFKEISEAYEVLIDKEKRAGYDQYGHAGVEGAFKQGGFQWQDFHHYDDLKDIFGSADISDLLRGFGFGGAFGGEGRGGQRRGSDLEYQLEISFEEAVFGGEETITIPRYEACDECGGSGARPGSKKERCTECAGRGQVRSSNGFFSVVQTCQACGGEGSLIKTPCASCGGRGRVKMKRNIKVKIPAGIDSGSRLRIHGEGEAGPRGGQRGDLYILIFVKPHEIFERHDSDIYCEVPIAYATAVFGGEIEVPTIEGRIMMKIPPGTQGGRQFRLRNKGVAQLHGYGRGDQIVKIQIDIPTDLNQDEKKALKEFARVSAGERGPLSRSFVEKMKRIFR